MAGSVGSGKAGILSSTAHVPLGPARVLGGPWGAQHPPVSLPIPKGLSTPVHFCSDVCFLTLTSPIKTHREKPKTNKQKNLVSGCGGAQWASCLSMVSRVHAWVWRGLASLLPSMVSRVHAWVWRSPPHSRGQHSANLQFLCSNFGHPGRRGLLHHVKAGGGQGECFAPQ